MAFWQILASRGLILLISLKVYSLNPILTIKTSLIPGLGAFSYPYNLFRSYRSFKRPKTTEPKSVTGSDPIDFLNLCSGNGFPQGKVFQATFQCQRHRFGHTGVCLARGKPKIEMEIYRSRNRHHASIDYQYVIALRGNLGRDVAWTGHITNDGTRP